MADSDMIKGLQKSIDAVTGETGGDYSYLHHTPVTDKLDELADAISQGGGGGGASALSDLTDVDIPSTVQGGKVLKYDATEDKWVPGDDSGNVQSDWNESDSSSGAFILNKPTIPDAQVNSDWNAASGVAQILNKPTIPSSISSLVTEFTGTLTAGSTTVIIQNEGIVTGGTYEIFTDPELNHTDTTVTTGQIVITFPEQQSNVSVKVWRLA